MVARAFEQDMRAVRGWPWPMFCAAWARTLDEERDRLKRAWRRRQKAEDERTRRELLADLDAGE